MSNRRKNRLLKRRAFISVENGSAASARTHPLLQVVLTKPSLTVGYCLGVEGSLTLAVTTVAAEVAATRVLELSVAFGADADHR